MVKMIMINKICCFRLHSFALIWGWLGAVSSGLLAFLGLIALINSKAFIGIGDDPRIQLGESHFSLKWSLILIFYVFNFVRHWNVHGSWHIPLNRVDAHVHWSYLWSFEGKLICFVSFLVDTKFCSPNYYIPAFRENSRHLTSKYPILRDLWMDDPG